MLTEAKKLEEVATEMAKEAKEKISSAKTTDQVEADAEKIAILEQKQNQLKKNVEEANEVAK